MADNLTKEQRHKNMCNIRSSNTKLEQDIMKSLYKSGLRFRKNVKSLPGKPDIAIKKYKIAVFLDSCFWHKCPEHFKKPKSNLEYWEPKIQRNVERDKQINEYYKKENWHVLRIWEHEKKKDFDKTAAKIKKFIEENKTADI